MLLLEAIQTDCLSEDCPDFNPAALGALALAQLRMTDQNTGYLNVSNLTDSQVAELWRLVHRLVRWNGDMFVIIEFPTTPTKSAEPHLVNLDADDNKRRRLETNGAAVRAELAAQQRVDFARRDQERSQRLERTLEAMAAARQTRSDGRHR